MKFTLKILLSLTAGLSLLVPGYSVWGQTEATLFDREATVRLLGSTVTLAPGEERARTYGQLISWKPTFRSQIDPTTWPIQFGGGAGDWANHGGNAQKNGLSPVIGPVDESIAWEVDEPAIISFQPYILGDRVFVVRMKQFVGSTANDRIFAYDLESGNELWNKLLPYDGNNSQQWTAHVLGVNNDTVYVSRSGNGNSIEDHITAYSAENGSFVWESEDTTDTGTYGGCVFAPNGDLIVGSFDNIKRISAADGSTVWDESRSCPTSGACVPALGPDGVFIKISRPAGRTAIAKHDLATGKFLYRTKDITGLITQNAPFLSADGQTIYHAKQHSVGQNFLYSFTDTGTSLEYNWDTPINYSAYHLHAVGMDGSIYTYLPNDEFVRLDPKSGVVLDNAGVLAPRGTGPQTASDVNGNVFLSNGWASSPATDGRLWALSSDLKILFDLDFQRQNSGGPALGNNGTLVVADLAGVRAYRTTILLGDINRDGLVNLVDVAPFVELLQNGEFQAEADVNQDGAVDLLDVTPFVDLLAG